MKRSESKLLMRRIVVFVLIVWRRWDSSPIPKRYRNSERLTVNQAWEVARIIHP